MPRRNVRQVLPGRRWTRSAVVPLAAATALGAGVLLAVWGVLGFFDNPAGNYTCTSAGQRALAGQEDFVRRHLEDATDFEVTTYDCEDGSPGLLQFTTNLSPAAARAAFLSDSGCSVDPHDYGDPGVICDSADSGSVRLFFDDSSGNSRTGGQLGLER